MPKPKFTQEQIAYTLKQAQCRTYLPGVVAANGVVGGGDGGSVRSVDASDGDPGGDG